MAKFNKRRGGSEKGGNRGGDRDRKRGGGGGGRDRSDSDSRGPNR